MPLLRNPEVLIGENDLTELSYLHEAAVLNSLRVRFLQGNNIYTYCGIVLVAVNPYEQLPIYGEDVIAAYSGKCRGELDPHIFAVAEEAYTQMARDGRNQSIIISGESGAGKTMSAKYVVRYFASVGGACVDKNVEERVLASNPIMEAIGNAKTTRNDNSSRFGKYVEIGFSANYQIVGAGMRTYLLEKSRVTFQADAERNYHIFYQLCACSSQPELQALQLAEASHFNYTNQGGSISVEGLSDSGNLQRTRKAFSQLGFSSLEQFEIFRILSAILHLGNVAILEHGTDSCYVEADDLHLDTFCCLIGVEYSQMAHWLCHRKLVTVTEIFVNPMSQSQAITNRDAIAKHMYGRLFHWIVKRVNEALRDGYPRHSFIGVLDIYGFETFKVNSFEQFCINYANEKLQQQFNWHVFQLEQADYIQEQIPWTLVDFCDNQQCIDLIEGKLGILDLLDEECKMPRGSDQSWALKMYERHLHSPHFRKPPLSQLAFIVLHFADKVEYSCSGFLEKNRDSIYEEPIKILRAATSDLISELFQDCSKDLQGSSGIDNRARDRVTVRPARRPLSNPKRENRRTIGYQFRASLQQLTMVLDSTNPHYVRCIKPNDHKKPFLFDPQRAVQQLRSCGVLETIRISAAGYPSRWTYKEFFSRYRLLTGPELPHANMKESCQQALQKLILDSSLYQLGNTKVFFCAGQVAHLERMRARRLLEACISLQRRLRGWVARKQYLRLRQSALTLQAYTRGMLARRLLLLLRRNRAAIILQAQHRMITARHHFLYMRKSVKTLQRYSRGLLARRLYHKMVREQKAVILQSHIRCWLARRFFARARSAIVLLQSCWRRVCACKLLRLLKLEARSVKRYQQLNKGLEIKIMQLQCQVTEQDGELRNLRHEVAQLMASLKVDKMADRTTELSQSLDTERSQLQNLQRDFSMLEQQNRELRERSFFKVPLSVWQADETSLMDSQRKPIYGNINALATSTPMVSELAHIEDFTTNLSLENQSLREQVEKQQRNVRKLKRKLKQYMRKETEITEPPVFRVPSHSTQEMSHPPDVLEQVVRPWQGMLVCHPEDEDQLIQSIITDLHPQSVLDFEPELPAYILFMCFRYADYCSAEHCILSLFTATVTGIKSVVKKNSSDFELLSFWLSNSIRLMHCMKQYSGELDTSQENTSEQNQHCLQHFDMSSHCHSLSSLCASIYKRLLQAAEERLQPMILSGMLENDSIQGLPCPRVAGLRGDPPRDSLNSLLLVLSSFHATLQRCHVQIDVTAQILRHIMHVLSGVTLNHLLLHKDVCCWSRGVQIRYNICQVEEWLRGRGLHTAWMMKPLEPLVQASQLLQVKKQTEDDAQAVCSMCTELSSAQVVKILGLYTPLNDFEERVPPSFIRSVQGRLKGRTGSQTTSQFLVDVNAFLPARFPYTRSGVCLNKLCLPDNVNLSFLRRL
ncbi:unconventional myosin-Vb-like [Discoglossus pictus]